MRCTSCRYDSSLINKDESGFMKASESFVEIMSKEKLSVTNPNKPNANGDLTLEVRLLACPKCKVVRMEYL